LPLLLHVVGQLADLNHRRGPYRKADSIDLEPGDDGWLRLHNTQHSAGHKPQSQFYFPVLVT
jgi:hypothetical protein